MARLANAADRFWTKVTRGDGCWEWTRRVDRAGFGAFSLSRRRIVRAHRYSYLLATGHDPGRRSVLHRCGNRRCVRPDHLYLGSARAKLSADDVRELRRLHTDGLSFNELSRRFGVAVGNVHQIVHRKTWAHVV